MFCDAGLLMKRLEFSFVGHNNFLSRGSNVKTVLRSWIVQKQAAVCSCQPLTCWVRPFCHGPGVPAHACLACPRCKAFTAVYRPFSGLRLQDAALRDEAHLLQTEDTSIKVVDSPRSVVPFGNEI